MLPSGRRRQPLPRTRLRIRGAHDVRYHRRRRPRLRCQHLRQPLERHAADGDQRHRADAALPHCDALQALRRPGITLSVVW